jgi:hypothetical protein
MKTSQSTLASLCIAFAATSVFGCAGGSGTSSHPTTHADSGTGTSGDDASMTTSPSGDDSGSMTTTTSGDDSGSTTTTTGDDTGTTTGTTDACKPPGKLYPPKAGATDFYCPFGSKEAGTNYCKNGTEHCCEPATGTSTCEASGTACATGDTDWQCDDASECGSGMVCCAAATWHAGAAGCENYVSGFKGSHCAASCATGEITICQQATSCSGGTTCTPTAIKGNSVGVCQ